MIRSLRRRHLILSFLMLMGLPLLVLHSYFHTSKSMTMAVLPKFAAGKIESFPLEVWHKPRLWKNLPELNTRLLANTSPEHALAIELTFYGTITNPDVLLYWSPRSFSVKTGIGDTMHMLGKFSSKEPTLFRLPPVARHRDGFLILYSLAEDEIVSEAPLVNPLK